MGKQLPVCNMWFPRLRIPSLLSTLLRNMGARERKTKKSLIDDPGEEEKYTPETDSVRYTAEVSTGFFFLVERGKEGKLSRVMLLVKMAPLSLSCSSPERTQPGLFFSVRRQRRVPITPSLCCLFFRRHGFGSISPPSSCRRYPLHGADL